jgi:hypothetical protein
MLGEIIGEVFIQFFVEIISPFLKLTGSLRRWLICLEKTPFKDILKKDYKTRVGLIIT